MSKSVSYKDRNFYSLSDFSGLNSEDKASQVMPNFAVDMENLSLDSGTLRTRSSLSFSRSIPFTLESGDKLLDYYYFRGNYVYLTLKHLYFVIYLNEGYFCFNEDGVIKINTTGLEDNKIGVSVLKGYSFQNLNLDSSCKPMFQEEKDCLFIFCIGRILVLSYNNNVLYLYDIYDKPVYSGTDETIINYLKDLPESYIPTIAVVGDNTTPIDDVNMISAKRKYQLFPKSKPETDGTYLYYLPTDFTEKNESYNTTVKLPQSSSTSSNVFPEYYSYFKTTDSVTSSFFADNNAKILNIIDASFVNISDFSPASPGNYPCLKETLVLTDSEKEIRVGDENDYSTVQNYSFNLKEHKVLFSYLSNNKTIYQMILDLLEDKLLFNRDNNYYIPFYIDVEYNVDYQKEDGSVYKTEKEPGKICFVLYFPVVHSAHIISSTVTELQNAPQNYTTLIGYDVNDEDFISNYTANKNINSITSENISDITENYKLINRTVTETINSVSTDYPTLDETLTYISNQIEQEQKYYRDGSVYSHISLDDSILDDDNIDENSFVKAGYTISDMNSVYVHNSVINTYSKYIKKSAYGIENDTFDISFKDINDLLSKIKDTLYDIYNPNDAADSTTITKVILKVQGINSSGYNIYGLFLFTDISTSESEKYAEDASFYQNQIRAIKVTSDTNVKDYFISEYDEKSQSFKLSFKTKFIDLYTNDYTPIDFIVTYKNNYNYDRVAKCSIGTVFGIEDRVILAGHPDFPNIDRYNVSNNILNVLDASQSYEMSYFPAKNYDVVGGFGKINSFSVASDNVLYITKEKYNNDSVFFVRTRSLTDEGAVYYSDTRTSVDKTPLNDKCIARFLNDTVFLSDDGLYALVLDENVLTSKRLVVHRDSFINTELKKAISNATNKMIAVYGKNLYIFLDKVVYVADYRLLSKDSEGNVVYNFVRWLLPHSIISVRTFENKLELRKDNNGMIYTFGDSSEDEECLSSFRVNQTHTVSSYVDIANKKFVFNNGNIFCPTLINAEGEYTLDVPAEFISSKEHLYVERITTQGDGTLSVETVLHQYSNKIKLNVENGVINNIYYGYNNDFDEVYNVNFGGWYDTGDREITFNGDELSEQISNVLIDLLSNNTFVENVLKQYTFSCSSSVANVISSLKDEEEDFVVNFYDKDFVKQKIKVGTYTDTFGETSDIYSEDFTILDSNSGYRNLTFATILNPDVATPMVLNKNIVYISIKTKTDIKFYYKTPVMNFGSEVSEKTLFKTLFLANRLGNVTEFDYGFRTMKNYDELKDLIKFQSFNLSNNLDFSDFTFETLALSTFSEFGSNVNTKKNNFLYIQFIIKGCGLIQINSVKFLYKTNRLLKTLS